MSWTAIDHTDEDGIYYVTAHYLVDLLDISRSLIYGLLKKEKVSYKEILNPKRGLKEKFFQYDDIFHKIPQFEEKRLKVRELRGLPDEHYLKKERPDDLSEGQFRILCATIVWRNFYDEWPTTTQLVEVLHQHSYSYFYVKDCLLKLQKKGYLTIEHYYGSKNTRRFIKIHLGPKKLIMKKMRCEHCDHVTYVSRDYVKPKTG